MMGRNIFLDDSVNVCMSADIANTLDYPSVVKTVESALNGEGLNLLINNAGMAVRQRLEDVTEDILIKHFQVNAAAPLLLVQVTVLHLDDDRCASLWKVENPI